MPLLRVDPKSPLCHDQVLENKQVMRKMGQKCSFSKIVLDRILRLVYFWCTSAYTCPSLVQDLTEREEADVRHEDKSQIGSMPGRQGLAVCLFARL